MGAACNWAVDSAARAFISRPFIGVGGPRKGIPVMASAKRTTPFIVARLGVVKNEGYQL